MPNPMLRTYLILFMSLFSTLLANAFDYSASDNQSVSPKKLAVEGRTWWYRGLTNATLYNQEWGIRIGEEITIDNEIWNKVDLCLHTSEYKAGEIPTYHTEPVTIAYIKDDGRTVCAVKNKEAELIRAIEPYLLLSSDFSIPFYLYMFGDVSEKSIYGEGKWVNPYEIKEISEITNSGIKYRKFKAIVPPNYSGCHLLDREQGYEYIEGIGHPSYFMLMPYGGGISAIGSFGYPELTYVTEGDDNHVIFEAAGGAKLWEMSGVESVVADPETGVEQWFNLQGVSISQPSAPGLYIRRIGSKTEKIVVR